MITEHEEYWREEDVGKLCKRKVSWSGVASVGSLLMERLVEEVTSLGIYDIIIKVLKFLPIIYIKSWFIW